MKLYNCATPQEIELRETELEALGDEDLKLLSDGIKFSWEHGYIEDENIAINALVQIVEELHERFEKINTAFEYWEKMLKKDGVID